MVQIYFVLVATCKGVSIGGVEGLQPPTFLEIGVSPCTFYEVALILYSSYIGRQEDDQRLLTFCVTLVALQ